MDIKADTISARMDTTGHEWTPRVDTSYISNARWTRMDTISCPFVSNDGPARIQISRGFARWLPEPKWQVDHLEGAGMWPESVFTGCGLPIL